MIPSTLSEKEVLIRPKQTSHIIFQFAQKYADLLTTPRIATILRDICVKSSTIRMVSPFITRKGLECLLKDVKRDVPVKLIVGTRKSYLEVRKIVEKLERDIMIKLRGRVHGKMVLTDNEIMIGSANITGMGLKTSIEASVITNNPDVMDNAGKFFDALWTGNYRFYVERDYGCFDIERMRFEDIIFVTSLCNLPHLMLKLVSLAKESIIFSTPTYTYDAMQILLNNAKDGVNIEVFAKLDESDWVKRGVSDPFAIRLLLERGQTVWNNSRLHAKILVIDNKIALVSSANVTYESFKSIYDIGILTKNKKILEQLNQFADFLRRKSKKVEFDQFEDMLVEYGAKLPFIVIQEEGDHFSDEKETPIAMNSLKRIEASPSEYPKHAGEELSLPRLPTPLQAIKGRTIKAKPADVTDEGIILVGDKDLTSYIKAFYTLTSFFNRKIITIKARGRFISKAVDIVRLLKVIPTLKIMDIHIGTSQLIRSDGKLKLISFIEIRLSFE